MATTKTSNGGEAKTKSACTSSPTKVPLASPLSLFTSTKAVALADLYLEGRGPCDTCDGV